MSTIVASQDWSRGLKNVVEDIADVYHKMTKEVVEGLSAGRI